MAIATLNAHVHFALEAYKQLNKAYLVIGKTSPWDNEENPPTESESTDSLLEIIGYKRLKQYSLARPLKQEETADDISYPVVTYAGLEWALIPTDKAYEEGARWLYISAEIEPSDFPYGEYRQVGIQTNVQPKQGINKPNLLPSEVADEGTLLFYENREPQNRTSSVYVLEQFMVRV